MTPNRSWPCEAEGGKAWMKHASSRGDKLSEASGAPWQAGKLW